MGNSSRTDGLTQYYTVSESQHAEDIVSLQKKNSQTICEKWTNGNFLAGGAIRRIVIQNMKLIFMEEQNLGEHRL